jgi:hypothetical protein
VCFNIRCLYLRWFRITMIRELTTLGISKIMKSNTSQTLQRLKTNSLFLKVSAINKAKWSNWESKWYLMTEMKIGNMILCLINLFQFPILKFKISSMIWRWHLKVFILISQI